MIITLAQARAVILQALALLGIKPTFESIRMLLAIGLQESGFRARVQMGGGPAHSFWQFEAGGGVKGIMTHPASTAMLKDLCRQRGVEFSRTAIWEAMAKDDVLGAGAARLLLRTDPRPMPVDGAAGWTVYNSVWRPGKPHPKRWPQHWADATEAARA